MILYQFDNEDIALWNKLCPKKPLQENYSSPQEIISKLLSIYNGKYVPGKQGQDYFKFIHHLKKKNFPYTEYLKICCLDYDYSYSLPYKDIVRYYITEIYQDKNYTLTPEEAIYLLSPIKKNLPHNYFTHLIVLTKIRPVPVNQESLFYAMDEIAKGTDTLNLNVQSLIYDYFSKYGGNDDWQRYCPDLLKAPIENTFYIQYQWQVNFKSLAYRYELEREESYGAGLELVCNKFIKAMVEKEFIGQLDSNINIIYPPSFTYQKNSNGIYTYTFILKDSQSAQQLAKLTESLFYQLMDYSNIKEYGLENLKDLDVQKFLQKAYLKNKLDNGLKQNMNDKTWLKI